MQLHKCTQCTLLSLINCIWITYILSVTYFQKKIWDVDIAADYVAYLFNTHVHVCGTSLNFIVCRIILPYFGKRTQVTYHLNLSYWCFHILPTCSVFFSQDKFHAQTLILLRDMLHVGKTSWYSIDVSGNDRHIFLFYKKCHFCHLLPFAKLRQHTKGWLDSLVTEIHVTVKYSGTSLWRAQR